MPPRSKITTLPDDLLAELNQRLIGGGFSGYVELAEWLTEQGWEIGKSAVHAYGQKLERRLSAIKASTEAARAIAAAAPDEADERSAAVISLLQTEIFDVLVALQEAEEADAGDRIKLLSRAAKSIAELTRASIAQKRRADEVTGRLKAKIAELEGDAKAGRSGLDLDTLRIVREEVYGLVS